MIIWKYGIRNDWMSINPNKGVGGQGGMIQHWPRPFPWKLPSQKMPRNLFNLQSNMTKETKQCCCIKLWRLFVLKEVGAWSILKVEQLLTVLRSGSKSSINMFARKNSSYMYKWDCFLNSCTLNRPSNTKYSFSVQTFLWFSWYSLMDLLLVQSDRKASKTMDSQ